MVAPHVGAWIEMSRWLTRINCKIVAPHVGAWIEILKKRFEKKRTVVAPHVGAWIEIWISYYTIKWIMSHLT